MKQKTALINGTIYTGDTVLSNHAVLIADGSIVGTPPSSEIPNGFEIINVNNTIVAPGFIDIQVNGGGGTLFNADPTPEALRTISEAHERHGTLYFCPTVISADIGTMERCLTAVSQTVNAGIGVLGAHLEGPYLSQKRPGVHEKCFIRPADDAEIDRLLSIGHISLVTAAPESITAQQIKRFTDAGIRVFLGHTDASCKDALAAFAAGACGVTHLYNAMSQLTGREPGVAGASFLSHDTWAGIIVDGIHVDWSSVRVAKELKKTRLLLVTDAMPPVGKPEAVYYIGEEEVVCKDGRCATRSGTLAGSALDMASAVRNSVDHCGIVLDEALRMASLYPAEALGLADKLGRIQSGYAADMVILDDSLSVKGVIRGGIPRWLQ